MAHAIIDFMRACVVKLIALEIYLGRFAAVLLARIFCKALCEIKRGRAAYIMGEKLIKLGQEIRIGLGFGVGFLQLKNGRHERLGDIASAKITKAPVLVRRCYILWLSHAELLS